VADRKTCLSGRSIGNPGRNRKAPILADWRGKFEAQFPVGVDDAYAFCGKGCIASRKAVKGFSIGCGVQNSVIVGRGRKNFFQTRCAELCFVGHVFYPLSIRLLRQGIVT
jgi:hypothetical protein